MSSADTPARQVSRPLLIALAVLGVAVLAYVLLVLPNLGGDVEQAAPLGSEPVTGVPVPGGSEPAVGEPAPSEPGDQAPVDEASETAADPSFEVFNARDPFEQLVVDDTGGAGATTDTGAVDGTTDTGAVGGTTDTGGGTGSGGGSGAGAGGSGDGGTTGPADDGAQQTVGTTTIRLEEVFDDGGTATVLVLVDDEGYEATEGETVAGDLTVLDIAGNCATMRFEARRFILCEGEQVRK